ncbi:MAG: hypothetical protein WBP81_06545 [Solirubrobacteraceae bacterium]
MIEDREALDLLDPREMRIDSVDGCLDLGADSVVARHRRRVGGMPIPAASRAAASLSSIY